MDPSYNPDTTNARHQETELQVLKAIFCDEWTAEDETIFSINISSSSGDKVYFQVTLPETYPLNSPPSYQISAPWMHRKAKQKLVSALEDIMRQNIGESIIYMCIDKIQHFIEQEAYVQLKNRGRNRASTDGDVQDVGLENIPATKGLVDELPTMEHGETIIDRKSIFQAHVARIVSVEQVKPLLEKLKKEHKKVASAKHNIYAYRIGGQNTKLFIEDCEDDGESKAGAGLLHLLQVVDASDVLVVVTRWYGGIHLGPDRFKHINNSARILLNQLGFKKDEKAKRPSSNSKK